MAKLKNYDTDINHRIGTTIFEYDIRQANINMLYSNERLSESDYKMLSDAPKQFREVFIGKMIRNDGFAYSDDTQTTISEGITKAKDMFLTANNVLNSQIIRISNDAIYVESNMPLKQTRFDLNGNGRMIEFACKGCYSSYLRFHAYDALPKIIVFFNIYDKNGDENFDVDVKGISDDMLHLHSKLLSFICNILYYKEKSNDIKIVMDEFNEFYERYIKLELPVECYREFNAGSSYSIKAKFPGGNTPQPMFFDEDAWSKDILDISYNQNILRELYSMILS